MKRPLPIVAALALVIGTLASHAGAVIISGSTVTLQASDRTADNTALIQGYMNNTTYTRIIIQPGTGGAAWETMPLFFNRNNLEINLASGTTLKSKAGYGSTARVLSAIDRTNVKVTGAGAAVSKILMNKSEYAAQPASEYRHAILFQGCTDVTISGLTVEGAGGDGIYIGSSSANSRSSNVLIDGVVVDNNGRNGIGIISVNGLTLRNSILKNTKGEGNIAVDGPWVGIHFEPKTPVEVLQNILMENCETYGNNGAGIRLVGTDNNGSTAVMNIIVRDCAIYNNQDGIIIRNVRASLSSSSSLLFKDCSITDNRGYSIFVRNKSQDAGTLKFVNCFAKHNGLKTTSASIEVRAENTSEVCGNIQFENMVVAQPLNRTVDAYLRVNGISANVNNVSGTIYRSSGYLSQIGLYSNINVTGVTLNPTSRWKLDETTGSTASDTHGGRTGTLYNTPVWSVGRVGGGLTLNGTNQWVFIPNDSSLNVGTGNFSLSFWVQRASSSNQYARLYYKGANSETQTGFAVMGSNSTISLMLCNGTSRSTTTCTLPSLNTWHHVAFTVDRAANKVYGYINGVKNTEKTLNGYNGVNLTNSINVQIGASSSSGQNAWPGKVDDVRFYNRMLTPGEAADFAVSPSVWWRFDETSGTSAWDTLGRSSGTLVNGPSWTAGVLGNALTLNGINQLVQVTSNSGDLNVGTENFSLAFWVQRASSTNTNARIFYKGASSDTQVGYTVAGANNSIRLLLCNGTSRSTTTCTLPSLNTWHHVAFTVDRAANKVIGYINGVKATEKTLTGYTGINLNNTFGALISANTTSGLNAWPGKVDEFRFYKRVLSASEVAALQVTPPALLKVAAFPGAEGGGSESVGGRGGIVYEVTNLNDAGPGSLRYGIELTGPRTIVFRVGGTIELKKALAILNPYITIAGQTAPGGGIQLSGRTMSQHVVAINTHDVVLRYLRIRKGHGATYVAGGVDAIKIETTSNTNALRPEKIVLDHLSVYWSHDENIGIWGTSTVGGRDIPNRISIQNCIIAEPLRGHAAGLLTGSNGTVNAALMKDIDCHRNLFAFNAFRSPLFKNDNSRFINNIIYHWSIFATQAGGGSFDFIGNLYKHPDPNGIRSERRYEIQVYRRDTNCNSAADLDNSIYAVGNQGPWHPDPSDNFQMVAKLNCTHGLRQESLQSQYRRSSPLAPVGIQISVMPVQALEGALLPIVGASRRLDCMGKWVANRDAADTRVVQGVLSNYDPGWPYDSNYQQYGIVSEDEVGGFPVIASGVACTDTDKDGMPDNWETAMGLNPNNPSDRNELHASGLTNLEAYLSGEYGINP